MASQNGGAGKGFEVVGMKESKGAQQSVCVCALPGNKSICWDKQCQWSNGQKEEGEGEGESARTNMYRSARQQ